MTIIPLRFLRIDSTELPEKVAITSSTLEVLEFTDNSPARATELIVQSRNLRRLVAETSRVALCAESVSLEYVSLSNVRSLVSAVPHNPNIVKFNSCSSEALLRIRPSEELLVENMHNVDLRPEGSLSVLSIHRSTGIVLVTHAERPLEALLLNDVAFAPSQTAIHAKRVWLEFRRVTRKSLFRINLKGTTHLGTFCESGLFDQGIAGIRQRIGNGDLFAVSSTGSFDSWYAANRAWIRTHGYQSRLLFEKGFFVP